MGFASQGALILAGLAVFGIVAAIGWLLIRPKYKKDGSIESAMIKTHPIIYHDMYGTLVWIGFVPYAANNTYGLVQAITESGAAREFTAWDEELVPINNVTNAMGERAYYRFQPKESRTRAQQDSISDKHQQAASAAAAHRDATEARGKSQILEKNESQRINEQLENIGKVVKAATPKKGKGD